MKNTNKATHSDFMAVQCLKYHNLGAGGVIGNKTITFNGVSNKRIKQCISRKNRAIGGKL